MNPFDFPILNMQPMHDSDDFAFVIPEAVSDKPIAEVMESFSELADNMSAPGDVLGPAVEDGAATPDATPESEDRQRMMQEMQRDPNANRVRAGNSLCQFPTPLVVRYPVTESAYASVCEVFRQRLVTNRTASYAGSTNAQSGEDEGNIMGRIQDAFDAMNPRTPQPAGAPPLTVLQKASESGNRFDAYMPHSKDVIFVTSNVSPATHKQARAAQRERHAQACAAAEYVPHHRIYSYTHILT
jgi:hypothetical protein